MKSAQSIRPFGSLKVMRQATNSVLLHGANARVEMAALASDLFRLRASPKQFSRQPSWAVQRTEWPEITSVVRALKHSIRLQTEGGTIEMDLRNGRFRLITGEKRILLESDPRLSGFQNRTAKLAFLLTGNETFLGMGESCGPFDRRGLIQEFWNTDVLGHGGMNPGLRNLYVSIPFTVLLRGGNACGMFWDNPARQSWDLGQTRCDLWRLTAAFGPMDLYLFTGPRVSGVVQRYTELTGHMPMPPRWATGYQQCRYSYTNRTELEGVARQLRRRRIPCDALYLDIHHMDGFRVFTFGRSFPKPKEMIARLRRKGFQTVAIVDPGVKADPKFGVFQRGRKLNAFVRTADGKRDYVGEVWPGRAVYPDFLSQRVRDWWGNEQARLQRLGMAGFWNDMNEPSNFILPSKTLPENCQHQSDHGPMRHAEAHNLYGMQMARASRDGALKHQPGQRPFQITRATYAGGQRHSIVWTGDNASSWDQLADAVQMYLNLGLSGFPFCGGDAGGFLDNCTPELYARWMQMAAFVPFFRNHTSVGTLPHEPWRFGSEVEAIVRNHIELRYQLLPYWYCLFAEAHRAGTPIMRPMVWHSQDDPVAAACGDQFMVGASLLVAPILTQGAVARAVYLPEGTWFDFWTGEAHEGKQHVVAHAPLDRLPLFVRGGAVLPMTALRQHTSGPAPTEISLHVWPGASGALDWYEDDGISQRHLNGEFHRRRIELKMKRDALTLTFGPATGSYASRIARWRIVLGNEHPLGVLEQKAVGEQGSFVFRLEREWLVRGRIAKT